jgi:hypothetical protein
MRRLVVFLAFGLAVALAGCGDSDPSLPRVDAGGAHWQSIARSMPAVAASKSPNLCGRGAPGCIQAVMAEMNRRLDLLAARCDDNAAFSLMYLRVTQRAGGADASKFSDPRFLDHLDAVFARLYFGAFDNWRGGHRSRVPEAWRLAFESADKRQVAGIGDMLLGMNAHISRDLPFALAQTGLRTLTGQSGEPDFNRVNALLGRVQGPLLAEESQRFDRGIASASLPLALGASSSVAQLIARWRTEAWHNAERLIAAPSPGARAQVARGIEIAAAGRARLLIALTSNLVIGPGAAQRLRYCREQRGR